jgi:hypothetical protein
MNRILLFALGIATFLGMAVTSTDLNAQIYSEYEGVVIEGGHPYQELVYPEKRQVLYAQDFKVHGIVDPDNGYYVNKVTLPFPFEYNGKLHTDLWISVNGFVTFADSYPYTDVNQPESLFKYGTNFGVDMVAPFFGDHYYRTGADNFPGEWNNYMTSEISWGIDSLRAGENDTATGKVAFVVQWKNLNINEPSLTSSVANFQLRLVESAYDNSNQGDIEFCYGTIGGNTSTTLTDVVYKEASVGIKGQNEESMGASDFMNGLFYDHDGEEYTVDDIRTATDLTYRWQPSGGSDLRIVFKARGLRRSAGWGDGDVDLSGVIGNKHEWMKQSRFVTVNDAYLIMRAVVTLVPLDSVNKRAAYHADVNHNGRFFYYYVPDSDEVIRTDLWWQDKYFQDSTQYMTVFDEILGRDVVISTGINSPQRIFFQADELDAAMILHYMAARIVSLPWIYPMGQYGKAISADEIADGITLGNAVSTNDGTYKVPVYLNGYVNGPLAFSLNVNGEILDINYDKYEDNRVLADFDANRAVISASGEFSANAPVCYITVKTDATDLNVSNVKFNGDATNDLNAALVEDNEVNTAATIEARPSVVTANNAMIYVNVPSKGNYTINIYDQLGNTVETRNEMLDGETMIEWNCDAVATGVYVMTVNGQNVSISNQLVVRK